MLLLDYKIPKYLEGIYEELWQLYKLTNTITPRSKEKLSNAVKCMLYNTSWCVQRGFDEVPVVLRKNYYSKPLIYNGNKVDRSVSYKYMMEVLEWLCKEELCSLSKGSVKSWNAGINVSPKDCVGSTLKLGSYIIDSIRSVTDKQPVINPESVLEVKDSEGNIIPKRLCGETKHLIGLLQEYNQISSTTNIEHMGQRYWVNAKKVFNNSSLQCGGRTYMTGNTNIIQKSVRKDLKINGKPVTELDYTAIHLAIIAESESVRWDKTFDPYSIRLQGYDPNTLRSLAKVAVLCAVNAKNYNTARKAFNFEVMKKFKPNLLKRKKLVPSVISSTDIMNAVLENNPYAEDWLYKSKGGLLQNIDSKMMDNVIDNFQQHGNFLIPLHDGIICQKDFTVKAEQFMIKSYKHVLGSTDNCRITIK